MDFEDFLRLLRALEQHRVAYVLVGATALSVHGLVRATEDIDLFVLPEARNVAALKEAMKSVWNDPEIDQISVDDLTGEYPTIRYVPPGGAPVVDLIARLGTALQFDQLEAQDVMIENTKARVATPRALYRMKRDTVRPLDRMDAQALREKFDLEDD